MLYSLLVISQSLHGVGMFSGRLFGEKNANIGLLGKLLAGETGKAFGLFVTAFIAFLTFSVFNGYSLNGIVLFNEMLQTDSVFGFRYFKRKFDKEKRDNWSGFMYFFVVSMGWLFVMGLPMIIANNDAYVDGFSNFATLFVFAIYGTTILFYTLKRLHFAHKNKFNDVFYNIFAWMAIIGIYFVVAYSLFWTFQPAGGLIAFTLGKSQVRPFPWPRWGCRLKNGDTHARISCLYDPTCCFHYRANVQLLLD